MEFLPQLRSGYERGDGMTWGDIYKQFTKEFPKAEATDYRPYVEGYLPFRRPGIIVWLKNGDVIAYFPKKDRTEGNKE